MALDEKHSIDESSVSEDGSACLVRVGGIEHRRYADDTVLSTEVFVGAASLAVAVNCGFLKAGHDVQLRTKTTPCSINSIACLQRNKITQ